MPPPFAAPAPSPPAAAYSRPGPAPRAPRAPRNRGGLIKRIALLVVFALIGFGVYVDTQITRVSALKGGTSLSTDGTNWLIVGSDSRADLTEQQEQQLTTGNAAGQRTDTIMLLHSGSSGAALVSLPRDSLLAIPGHGRNKLNASFSFGGPQLLVRTVENATGLRIDHYAEIGFGGFVQVVDAVGGVEMCIPSAMKDPKAGLNLKAGCQTLDGDKALGYVRTRATPRADLDRIEHQRTFLAALMKQIVSPFTLLNPFRWVALTQALPGALSVDSGDHVWHILGLGLAMRSLSAGDGLRTTVPISGLDNVNGSSVVRWDSARAKALFGALAKDETPPKSSLG